MEDLLWEDARIKRWRYISAASVTDGETPFPSIKDRIAGYLVQGTACCNLCQLPFPDDEHLKIIAPKDVCGSCGRLVCQTCKTNNWYIMMKLIRVISMAKRLKMRPGR